MISTGRDGSICEDMPSCPQCHLSVVAGVPVHQDFCPRYLVFVARSVSITEYLAEQEEESLNGNMPRERRDPKRYPPSPESLVGALNDPVDRGGPHKSRAVRACRVETKPRKP